MTSDPKAPRPLGDLERLVMDQLWAADGALTVREVHERLSGTRELAYTTVMTVLDRLAKKRLTERERDGKAWRYKAAGPREELAVDLMRDALDRAGDRREALVRFVGQVSDEEAALLREALSRLEAKDPGGGAAGGVRPAARELEEREG